MIRLAEEGDIEAARRVERAADTRFPPGALPSHEVTADETFLLALEAGCFLVVEDVDPSDAAPMGELIGFAIAVPHRECMHLEQLSVSPQSGRRGIGTALLEAVADDSLARGYRALSLTTFRGIEWNAPFYARRGFHEPSELPAYLAEILRDEQRMGFDAAERVALVRILESC